MCIPHRFTSRQVGSLPLHGPGTWAHTDHVFMLPCACTHMHAHSHTHTHTHTWPHLPDVSTHPHPPPHTHPHIHPQITSLWSQMTTGDVGGQDTGTCMIRPSSSYIMAGGWASVCMPARLCRVSSWTRKMAGGCAQSHVVDAAHTSCTA